jgi:rhodanese-related sulfurtransferase
VDGRRTINDLLAEARARIIRLGPEAAAEAMREGALLIDTRSADERRATGVIPGSVHVPLSVLWWRLDPAAELPDPALADPSRQVIVVCAHGYSSSIAASILRDIGYARAGDLDGGFEAWAAAGMPLEPAPA